MGKGGLMNSLWRYVVFVAMILFWLCQELPAQTSLSPVINPAGLEDQRLNLLSPEGYQLIEQANQALESGLSSRAEDRISQLLYQHAGFLCRYRRIRRFHWFWDPNLQRLVFHQF